MWLTRIEAERYGGLAQTGLGPLGPGLSVVLGPNEAGKSSFTALVRHVLYGFPDRRASERGYRAEGGGRHGRLVFASESGEWVIERIDGKGRGAVTVRTLSGPERPSLASELVRGVSAEAYRVVFGFGLADMADVVGTHDEIASRLYAAGAGISASPQDVRKEISAEAETLFKPGGRNPAINAAAREAAECAMKIRELSQEAEGLEGQRETLAALETQAREAGEVAREAERRRDVLANDVREIELIEERLRDVRKQLVEARTALAHANTIAEKVVPDERLLAAAPLIETLASETSAHRDRLNRVASLRSRIDDRERAEAQCLAEAGLDSGTAAHVSVDAETRTTIASFRDRLVRLELRAEDATRDAARAAQALHAARSSRPAEVAAGGSGSLSARAVAWGVVALGVAATIAGAATATWILAGFGFLFTVAGVVLALSGRASASSSGDASDRIEEGRLRSEVERSEVDARRDVEELGRARAEWDAWRDGRGLAGVSTPAAAGDVVSAVIEARRIAAEKATIVAELAAEEAAVDAFVVRASELAARTGREGAAVTAASAAELVTQAREALADTREQERIAATAVRDAGKLAPGIAALEATERAETDRVTALLAAHGVEGGHAEAAAYAEEAARDAASAREHFRELEEQRVGLAGAIGKAETETEAGALNLGLTGVRERIAAYAERYAVLQVALHLLGEAQEVYDRERQPGVVRDAGRVLSIMTGGRYGNVSIPLGTDKVSIFDSASRAKDIDILSTGTAEQLYLALRIALLGHLGEVGEGLPVLMDDVFANFDPGRKAGAAAAVAELARERQVVVFTCHPDTRALLEDASPGLTAIELDRC